MTKHKSSTKKQLEKRPFSDTGELPNPVVMTKIMHATMRAVREHGRTSILTLVLPEEICRVRGDRMRLWSGGPILTLMGIGRKARPNGTIEEVYALNCEAGYLLDALYDVYGERMKDLVNKEIERQKRRGKQVTFR